MCGNIKNILIFPEKTKIKLIAPCEKKIIKIGNMGLFQQHCYCGFSDFRSEYLVSRQNVFPSYRFSSSKQICDCLGT